MSEAPVPQEPVSIFDTDKEAVVLYDRLMATSARIDWLTGWKPTVNDGVPDTDAWPDEAVDLLPKWRALWADHTARVSKIDRARLSRFMGGVFDSADEERAARLWWYNRY